MQSAYSGSFHRRYRGQEPSNRECPDHIGAVGTYLCQELADMEVLGEGSEKRSVLEAEQRKLEHSDSKNVSIANL